MSESKSNKSPSYFLSAVIVLGAVFYFLSGPQEPQPMPAVDTSLQRQAVLDQFMSDDEPTTLAARWTTSLLLTLVVEDDGSNRNGYASYACQVMLDYNLADGHSVEVIDRTGALGETERKILGQAIC